MPGLESSKSNHCQITPENDPSSLWRASGFVKTTPGQFAAAGRSCGRLSCTELQTGLTGKVTFVYPA
jgi:hypothetical protein